MFGFSLTKLVVAAILILAVWHGFKLMTRIAEARTSPLGRNENGGKSSRRLEVEDLVECKRCHAFVSAGAKACGRADCPYPA